MCLRNRYFKGDWKLGIELVGDLEDFCISQQRRNFCRKNKRPLRDAENGSLMSALGFKIAEVNPHTCEGCRGGRMYYSHDGKVEYTDNKLKQFFISLFFKKIDYNEKQIPKTCLKKH